VSFIAPEEDVSVSAVLLSELAVVLVVSGSCEFIVVVSELEKSGSRENKRHCHSNVPTHGPSTALGWYGLNCSLNSFPSSPLPATENLIFFARPQHIEFPATNGMP
jgi:hypothetical protein